MLPLPTFPSHSAGYYMFIEASRPRVTGDKARLISPLYNITAKYYCVSFYYHMYGKHIGEYPPGKGKPSLMWASGEDLQPLAPAAVPATSNSRGWESYSGIPSNRVGCCSQILVLQPSSVRVMRLSQPILGAAPCSQSAHWRGEGEGALWGQRALWWPQLCWGGQDVCSPSCARGLPALPGSLLSLL